MFERLTVKLMSRAAAATATKGAQKAALKEKAATHAADLAMGLTSTMKKQMAGDTLLCRACQATALGPKTVCECPGGRTKPAVRIWDSNRAPSRHRKTHTTSPRIARARISVLQADYDAKVELLAAAMARDKTRKDAARGASAAQQASVQAAKAKNKAERDNSDALAELDLSALDMVDVVFEPGTKLGMSIGAYSDQTSLHPRRASRATLRRAFDQVLAPWLMLGS